MTLRLNVSAIGGAHRFAHFLPAAFEVCRRGRVDVRIFVPGAEDRASVARLARQLRYDAPDVTIMELPRGAAGMVPASLAKISRVLTWARKLRAADAILCAERTSMILKRLPGRSPPLIHIPHGAGDRAVGFEGRFRHFDQVIVAGSKDQDRLLREGLVTPDRCAVGGPIKVASMISADPPERVFDNDRPVLLYAPHFSSKLGSAHAFLDKLLAAVRSNERYNLIVAPHVRMTTGWSEGRRASWLAKQVPGRIMVDLGSERSIDMTYTRAADLYIGDVSSQVYEYLVYPRPCLFVNAHNAAWEGNEDYTMWQFGPVIEPGDDIMAAIARAFANKAHYLPIQKARIRLAFDGITWDEGGRPMLDRADPIERSATLIESYMLGRSA